MKKIVLLLILPAIAILNTAGQDTTFFDKIWKKTSKENASFYRVKSQEGNLFKVQDFYMDGQIQMTGFSLSADSLIREGLFKYYDKNGKLTSQGMYEHNHRTGVWEKFYSGGELYGSQFYNNKGKTDREFKIYYKNGNVRRSDVYSNGEFIKGKCFTLSGKDTTWYPFEVIPEFPGGYEKRIKYLKENITYPDEAKEYGIQGVVYVSFVVGEDGRIEDIKLLRGVNVLLDNEALRIVKNMPRWSPGQKDGKPGKAEVTLPVKFMLQ